MSSMPLIPKQAAIAVADLVDNCAKVKPGMNVLIVAANDGLHGGVNIVDRETVAWVHATIVQRGADATVVWCDIPSRPLVLWGDGADPSKAWRVPPIVANAMRAADVIISHAVDLTFEEELREVPDLLKERNIRYARNMATTTSLLTSNWGLTPYELVSEIRLQACALAKPGAKWVMTHPNGSHVEGTVVKPEDMDDYTHYRDIGPYCPFPEGVWSSIRARDAEGVGIINEIGVIWARHIGVPCPFKQPVRVVIEKGYIKKFEGGEEAETLTRFYKFISKYLGEAAYEVRGFHGGVHPSAMLEPHQCPNAPYRHFIEHHHWSSFHFHMGNSRRAKDFPYLMHISAELRGGDLKIGDNYVYRNGRITTADHPKVRAIAEKYRDRPGLEPEQWLQVPR
ncbi:MAG TPA: hypothetical protein VLJ79_23365 [Candidatus Binatia bacterium]|nr:hypothetical protein [Candidatus Binatia bacterium]